MFRGRILTKNILYEKEIVEDNLCNMCNSSNSIESCFHLFLECPLAAQVWQKLIGHMPKANDILAGHDIKLMSSLHTRGFGEIIWDIMPFTVLWEI
ncbi:hypothetical protein FRX31_014431 [Thalictrum thalictroides]|uniref:Reverse transcriptase zinc-binding domain-containing protein n=1 Tax=Thalictrum thalictroides TaxID=46969 RepID=A0A7J6WIM7_THATH|nr:hypothetical protein FRX31_014431 [Thalictrum thalictroides]